MGTHETEKRSLGKGDDKNEEARGSLTRYIGFAIERFNNLTIERGEAIHHFIYASRHKPRTRASAHLKESSAHGAVNQTITAL